MPIDPFADASRSIRALVCAASVASVLAASAAAGGSAENALLVVDPRKPQSLRVANHYRDVRGLPDVNVVYLDPNPGTYAQFAAVTSDAFLGAIENLALADHVDYVVLPPGPSFHTSAPGLVTDACASVNRFAVTAPFALAFQETTITAGGVPSLVVNGYYRGTDEARAFDAETLWLSGAPAAGGKRYLIAAMLGYDGPLGNTVEEILALIDRSAAVDGTRPAGTFYFMQTNDLARSGPRHGAYPAAVASIQSFGGAAQHLFADLPIGQQDCLGIMTGLADPDVTNANLTLLPGSFADHLTSYAATFDSSSQTKMSRWISKGASGTSGAVEEPCNYASKFPHARLHVFYAQGLSLGEAWFRSHGAWPFQTLFTGDPLTRPFAYLPTASLAGIPSGTASGLVVLTPSGATSHPTAQIGSFELLVDGRSHSKKAPGESFLLDTTALADGWHELRLLAYDDTLVKSVGRSIDSIDVDNEGRTATLAIAQPSGNLTTRFDFSASASGATVKELRLVQGSRVVASSSASPATLSVHGRGLGAGKVRLQLVAEFKSGRLAHSAPVEITIVDAAGTPGAIAPVAFSYTKHVRNDHAAIVELPATFDADLAQATWTLLSSPAQATVLASGDGPYRVIRPNAGALGADSLTFRCDTPAGVSNVATVSLFYGGPFTCPAPVPYCVAATNSTGSPAHIFGGGSTSLGANDFVIGAYGLPPDKAGIFLYSESAAQVPLGDGFRCVGAPIYRLGLVQSDFIGDVAKPIDWGVAPFSALAPVMTGGTGRFQLWYRDPDAGGAGTNLTEGLSVTFCY